MRLLLYLGKGGVGKTTIAAATAARCSALGYRTLIASTDIAHSLSDVMGRPLDSVPVQVEGRLWGQEINALLEARRHWQRLREILIDDWRRRVESPIAAEELAAVPGMDEVAALLQIREQACQNRFDVLVIDAAPTGETMRMLAVPESFEWYARRLAVEDERLGPLCRALGLRPSRELLDVLADLRREVSDLRATLTDPDISSYRVVVTPERVVLREAMRTLTYLALFGYPCDAVIVNRVLPSRPARTSRYMSRIKSVQEEQLRAIHAGIGPLPEYRVPWYSQEVVGLPALARLGRDLWGTADPTAVFWRGKSLEIEESGDEYLLRLALGRVEMDKVEMTKRGDQLFIRIGNFRRELVLPLALAARPASTAELTDEGVLEVRFPPAAGISG